MTAMGATSRYLWLVVRVVCGLALLFGCLKLILSSAATGLSRLSSTAAIASSKIELTDNAVKFSPADPEAHYTRALLLVNTERLDEAVAELRTALKLRPHHYYEWLDLGVTLDRLGDQSGALEALKESIRLAPSFAQPRWQLGNLLYRQGKYPEAFEQLRLGIASNPRLSESLIELAWACSNEKVSDLETFVRPATQRDRYQLANFLARQGKGEDAARNIITAGRPADAASLDLSRGAIYQLVAKNQFASAYAAWASVHNIPVKDNNLRFMNGDFTEPIPQDDPGFGWQLPPVVNVSRAIDSAGPAAGQRSFRVEFSGESPIASRVLTQLLLVRPKTRYLLNFMVRTDRLISGGPPIVAVVDANSATPRILGQSNAFPENSEWTAYALEFSTGPDTSAINVVVQRVACQESTCPIFGALRLAKFRIEAEG